MRYFMEKTFILCGLLLWQQLTTSLSGLSLLTSLLWCSLSFLEDFIEKPRLQVGICVLQIVALVYEPTLMFLLPLLIMQLFRKNTLLGIASFCLIGLHFNSWTFFLSLLVMYITYRTVQDTHQQAMSDAQVDTLQQEAFRLYHKQKLLTDEYSKNLELTKLAERNRISHELHDEIGHTISTTIMQLEALQLVTTDATTAPQLEKISTHLQQGMDRIRQTLHGMYDDTFQLDEKIQEMLDSIAPQATIHYQYHVPSTLPLTLRFDILAIIKEITTNFVKHSTSKKMHLYLMEHPNFYTIDYRDDSSLTNPVSPNGIGLIAMKEMVNTHNGQLTVDTQDGYHLFIRIPKEKEKPHDPHPTH